LSFARGERRVDLFGREIACGPQHEQMIEEIGRFIGQRGLVLRHRGETRLDGLLAQLLGRI